MGARAYIIKQDSDNSYQYMYSHWGASAFKRLIDEYYHSDEEITDEDIANRFNEIWNRSEEQDEELQTASSLDEIVDVEDIGIEAYIIEDQDGEYHAIFPTITSQVNVAVTKPLQSITDLKKLRNLHRKISDYIRVAENQELEEQTIREGVKNEANNYRRNRYTQLIEEDENPEKKLFQRIGKVIV